jgi:hypothetical protein
MRAIRTSAVAVAAALFVIVALGAGLGARPAFADAKSTKKDIQQKIKEAMENYDLLEYEEARKILNQALTLAKKAKIENDPVVAQVHLALGIVYYAGLQDSDSAKLSFISACEVDKKVQIDPAYKTPDMAKALIEACTDAGSEGSDTGDTGDTGDVGDIDVGGGGGGDVDCSAISGVDHDIIDTAKSGGDLKMTANLGSDVEAAKVAIMYRPQGATEFNEVKMSKKGECTFVGAIPKSALGGELVHYYIAAFNGAGKVIAGKGSAGSPNIIEVEGGSAGYVPNDDENPLGDGPRGGGGGSNAEVHVGASAGPAKPAKVYFNVAVGSGIGFVTGHTEQDNNKVQCCFAPALLNVVPEIGFFVAPTTSIGAAFRLGFPIGANIDGHSTAAPAALIRVRHSLGATQEGLAITGSIGAGILRNTITLTEATPGMDTDIVALGPLLVGVGAAYTKGLGGPIKFVAEASALAGVPVIDHLGSNPEVPMNFGVQLDVNLGLMFGF